MANVTDPRRESLVEQVLSAHRERDPRGGIKPSPAFFDLDEEGRIEAFDAAIEARALEAALDPNAHSTTVKAVLAAIARAGGST